MMFSDRELIQNIGRKSYTFKPASLPLGYNLSNTNQNIKEQNQQAPHVSTWIDIGKFYCPQVLKVYPYEKYQKQYDQEVQLIETQLKFQNSNQPGVKWTLLKSKQQIDKFSKRWSKIQPHHNRMKQSSKQGDIFSILTQFAVSNTKEQNIFQEFLQRMIPKQKWNLKVLGQYRVRSIEVQGLKNCMSNTICAPCRRSNKFFITLTNQNILLSEDTLLDGYVEEAIPYTKNLQVVYEVNEMQTYSYKFVIGIKSGRTFQVVSFQSLFDLLKFSYTFNQVRTDSPYFKPLRFESFSPEREHNWTRLYHDSQHYFSDLHDQIQLAQKKICITGWCITPYLLLKRPQNIENGDARLDHTLHRAAKRGVKIFIIVFQQPSLFVNNDSYNVWSLFQNMDENFKVLRHPGLIIPQLWSHHQKCCIIDQKVAFMGGLDMCYGRWDTHDHPIFDKDSLWQGADYNNQRQRSISKPRQYWKSNLDKQTQPRMPWHDIAFQFRGSAIIDLQRHFVQYWYFAIKDLSDDPRDHLLNFKTRYEQLKRQHHIKKADKSNQQKQRQRLQLYSKTNPDPVEMKRIQYDYALQKKNDPKDDYSFSDRVKGAKQAFKDLIQNKTAITSKQIFVQGFGVNARPGNMKLQLCRSSCEWSTGIKTAQHSIYNAYMELIKNSKQFIYIENQFFMSHENLISEILAERIKIAYNRKQKFKVIVMMPLLPGFEGDVTQDTSGVLRVQMQIQYEAISRHPTSIFQILQKQVPQVNPFDYIGFYGVRNHALMGKNKDIPQTEIIYVHSKLMIVDDRFLICGSANINDRSLLGTRDSELAMVIEDPQGSFGKGSIFAFRCGIFKEHFGMSQNNCANIHSYWKKLSEIALNNTVIYRKVFGCYPDNTASKYSDVNRLVSEANKDLYFKQIRDLYGHYVQWPLDFLKDQNLHLKLGQKQFLAPITFFT